jgi:hypothetical protein
MFCAAIPTAAALGAVAHGKQQEAKREAERHDQPAPRPKLPASKVTMAIVVGLVICSAIYHTQQVV